MQIKSLLLITAGVTIAMAAGFWLSSQLNDASNLSEAPRLKDVNIHGAMLPVARNIVIPALLKDNGAVFSEADLNGHWSVIFFGYTQCPDICPTTMAVLKQAKDKASTEQTEFPQVIFVSVDPERDKIEMLGEYVRYFDKEFLGVTGDKEYIDALARQMSVVYMRVPSESGDPDNYTVDHSSAMLLMNPKGELAAFLTAPHTPAGILDSIKTVIANSS